MIDGRAPVETFDEIDSTILEARRRAERGETGPIWLVARRQTAGRGRRGRTWATCDGNLLATYLCTTSRPPTEIALLGFAAALAIADAVDSYIGPGRARLKWPNDVLVDNAKASGIMLDSGAGPAGVNWVALGLGVNLAAAPENLDQPATSLRALLPPDALAPEPLAFLSRLSDRLAAIDAQYQAHGFEPMRQAWLTRAHGLGREVQVLQGDQTLQGRISGLSARGELELETSNGRRLVAAGDVYFLEPV